MIGLESIGSCGIRVSNDTGGCGPNVHLADDADFGEIWFTLVRNGQRIDIARSECVEVADLLVAFEKGTR